MALRTVWGVLENGGWVCKEALSEATRVDDGMLSRIIHFLDRWDFVETRNTLVRRKPGAISPVETLDLLRAFSGESKHPSVPRTHHRLAERVACRVCGKEELNFIGQNEVECAECHEKQWFALERRPLTAPKTAELTDHHGLLRRTLIRFGFAQ
jgi:hypothetical protein